MTDTDLPAESPEPTMLGVEDRNGPSPITVDVQLDQSAWSTHLADQTEEGLRDDPPWIPPVWFYDEPGSEMFDEITRLPEYYPTEAERSILAEHAHDIASITGVETLAELGSGTSDKTALLLDAGQQSGTLNCFSPFDCSEEVLRRAAAQIAGARPGLDVHAVVGDFHEHLHAIPTDGVCVIAFLGSTIGNLDETQRKEFLANIADTLDDDDWFLLGTDLAKSESVLLPAYDDRAGVTARFNLNALSVMNTELLADFEVGEFRHRAVWDAEASRVEMQLVANSAQRVRFDALNGLELVLGAGDHIRTEISTKFTREQVESELAEAGMEVQRAWTDSGDRFLVTLSRLTRQN